MLSRKEFVKMTEAVCIGNDIVYQDIKNIAEAAKKYGFLFAYVPPCFTKHLIPLLKGSDTMAGAAATGSDCGGDPTEAKIAMAKYLLDLGCTELDIMMNLMYFRSKMYDEVLEDIKFVRRAFPDTTLKVIIESPLLTEDEIKTACQIVIESGADYVKTSTGTYGKTTIEQVKIIKAAVGDKLKIKAAGGINGVDMINELAGIGVSRFGLSYNKAVNLAEEMQ